MALQWSTARPSAPCPFPPATLPWKRQRRGINDADVRLQRSLPRRSFCSANVASKTLTILQITGMEKRPGTGAAQASRLRSLILGQQHPAMHSISHQGMDGQVTINGEVCTMRGKKLRSGDKFSFMGNAFVITDAAE